MPLRIEPHAEPIPGYRLIERLGSGGFGEVWKAEAPGGLFKAIKFVQRGASTSDDSVIGGTESDPSRAEQEWKSLMRVKMVRLPFILLLDRFENIDNFLVIVMELADRTLGDRFKECRGQGLPGIPREELLNYLAEAAEVLDLMNSQYQLQHLDIKPQNLFLVHQHIKVADFGLVKDTTDGKDLMTITGGVTPVYAAPETFDGQFSRQSDQYSLAIVYQEMLTSRRPFTGTSIKQLILQHLQNSHDLTPAPVLDRPILARGLAKNPEDRYPTCLEFVQALRQATMRAGTADAKTAPVALPTESPAPGHFRTIGARGVAGPIEAVEPNFSIADAFLADSVPPPLPSVPSSILCGALSKSSSMFTVAQRSRQASEPISASAIQGIVQPALVIGLGKVGVETLGQLRTHISAELGSPTALPHVRLLAIDIDPKTIQRAVQGNPHTTLRTQETLQARLQRPGHYLKARDGKLPTDGWLNAKLLHRIPRENTGAALRPLGRLAFVDNYRVIARRLEIELHALCSQDTPHDSEPYCDLGLRTSRPRVYIVTSLAGNTGSGMLIDLAYLVRRLLQEQGQKDAEIVGLFSMPTVRSDAVSFMPLANTYAALVELQHYCEPEAIFSASYETTASTTRSERVTATGPAFQRCILVPLADPIGKPDEADNSASLARTAGFLYRDLATSLGGTFDEQRTAKLAAGRPPPAGPLLQSFGMYRIHWPRHALLEQAGRRLANQLVTRWLNKDATPVADTIRQWTQERWESLGMRPENLIERFQELAENSLGQKPELALAAILDPLHSLLCTAPTDQAKGKATFHITPVVQAMDRLARLIGCPDDSRSNNTLTTEAPTLERALTEIALTIADECEQKLAEVAVKLLEDPQFRLAGAEEALRQFSTAVDQSLQSQETLAKELTEKSAQLYQRIQQLLDTPLQTASPTKLQWSLGLGRRAPASLANTSGADIFELLRAYTKTRFHSLVLSHLNGLYLSLRGHLSDQIREVGYCRQRLGELLGLLQPGAAMKRLVGGAGERALFPAGCIDLKDAVDQLNRSITPNDLLAFDNQVQQWITAQCQALLEICMGSSGMVRTLAPALLQEAESFLGARLHGTSVAQMYLSRKRASQHESTDPMIVADLEQCLHDATPGIGLPNDGNEVRIISFPNDNSGAQLQQLMQRRPGPLKTLLCERHEEIIFYRELINLQWNDLEQFGPIAREAYERRNVADPSALHTREDVFEWQVIAALNR